MSRAFKQAESLLNLDNMIRGERKEKLDDPKNETSILQGLLTAHLEDPEIEVDEPVFQVYGQYYSDRRLSAILETKPRRKKVADYQPMLSMDQVEAYLENKSLKFMPKETSNDAKKESFQEFMKRMVKEEYSSEFQTVRPSDEYEELHVKNKSEPQKPVFMSDYFGKTNARDNQDGRQKMKREALQKKNFLAPRTEEDNNAVLNQYGGFTTARQELVNNMIKKGQDPSALGVYSEPVYNQPGSGYAMDKIHQAVFKTTDKPSKKFIPPVCKPAAGTSVAVGNNSKKGEEADRYPGLDNKLVDVIEREIMQEGSTIDWDDIAGLAHAKQNIKEIIVWPLARPELFRGLRQPPKGLLLFGPPGTGKTMIGKAIASQLKYTFFNMSASSLTSKWVGEGEKLVKTLFQLALMKQPSVIFIDEIDSLLSARSENENEASRRIKTEFLVQLDGARGNSDDKILMIGATNRPEELDEAARRRFIKRLYIPLPDTHARLDIIKRNIEKDTKCGATNYSMSPEELNTIVEKTKGYSAADMHNLMVEAAMFPLRGVDIMETNPEDLRPVVYDDFSKALLTVKSSVDPAEVDRYRNWNKKFGSAELAEED